MLSMSRRKLRVVGYNKDFVDGDDDVDFKKFIIEMETTYLKKRSEEWVTRFQNENNTKTWNEQLSSYLSDCGLHYTNGGPRRIIIDEILNIVIAEIYSKNNIALNLTSVKFHNMKKAQEAQLQNTQNPLNAIDYSSPEFITRVSQLCRFLGIADHPDPVVCLKAACLFIKENLNDGIIQERNNEFKNGLVPKTFDLRSFPLGFPDKNDGAINAAIRVLRLLNIEAIRRTQTAVNETLVAVQNLTVDMDKRQDQSNYNK
uniref:Uncharacterized protein n=1 Tax=Heterorhabditis bacteriophora TaxID=37862 RepID=A0A1I7XUF8_HETBA